MNQSGLSTAVMAGGKSSRMGTDKSFAPLLGKPLIEHVVERVAGLSDELIVITNKRKEYDYLGLATFGDIYRDHGPLGGLHAALHEARYSHVLVVACDMPWLNRPLLEYMISLRHEADVIVPRWYKHPEPLHAVYSKECLRSIEESLKAGRLQVISFYEEVEVRYLERRFIADFDPDGRSFANVNTPEDLAAASKKPF